MGKQSPILIHYYWFVKISQDTLFKKQIFVFLPTIATKYPNRIFFSPELPQQPLTSIPRVAFCKRRLSPIKDAHKAENTHKSLPPALSPYRKMDCHFCNLVGRSIVKRKRHRDSKLAFLGKGSALVSVVSRTVEENGRAQI